MAGLHQCHTGKPAGAQEKITFDKLHVAKYFGAAVDKVRRQEHKALMAQGFEDLKGNKYDWLYNPDNMTRKQKQRFKVLRDSTLKAALNALLELTKKTQVILFSHHSQGSRTGETIARNATGTRTVKRPNTSLKHA